MNWLSVSAETSTPIHVDADATLRVRTPDAQALVAATSGLVEAVRRRSNRPATLCARLAGPASVSIWADSASSADHAVGDADASRQPVDLEQGGLGLSLRRLGDRRARRPTVAQQRRLAGGLTIPELNSERSASAIVDDDPLFTDYPPRCCVRAYEATSTRGPALLAELACPPRRRSCRSAS
jgi:hypothetical protein